MQPDELTTGKFVSGVQNTLPDEEIAQDASRDSYNWFVQDGSIILIPGKALVGAEGAVGKVQGEIFGYKVDGTKVHYRKIGTVIQYFDGTTWQNVVTGLSAANDYVFTNYPSLAGNFTFAIGLDGIYKMNNANPGSFVSLYNSAKNFKFRGAFIDLGRMIAWGRTEDRTGLYGSRIDPQNSTVYTTVTGEILGASGSLSYSGTLAFKGGGATRNAFGITITATTGAGVETFTDNYVGGLVGSLGGTGTINYTTGAYSVTFNGIVTSGNVVAAYQWEDSNNGGVTDFTKSATRLAGEGFVLRQDEGGDAILTVEIGLDQAYYSLKSQSAYRLELDVTDTAPINKVFRREIGIPCATASTATQKGIMFINTANKERPEITILQQNPLGGNVEPFQLFPQFKFQNYLYDQAVMDTYGRYVLLSCRTANSLVNDITLLLNPTDNNVSVTGYGAATFAKDGSNLYMGSPITQSVYQLFIDFDDDGTLIENFWEGRGELFGVENLKKYKYEILSGLIDPGQYYEVYVDYDDSGFQLIGTVLGSGDYVDYSNPQTIGSNVVGGEIVGGGSNAVAYPYLMQIKMKVPKFRKRVIKFVAKGFGYVSIDRFRDKGLLFFENKLPKKYRQKNYVSIDGTETGLPLPQY